MIDLQWALSNEKQCLGDAFVYGTTMRLIDGAFYGHKFKF
jgi:hypothetical protein